MNRDTLKLPETPKEAFEQYILKLEREYQPWYERASTFNKVIFVTAQGIAITAGASAAFIAGLTDEAQLVTLKVWLVLLPLVAAFATAVLPRHGFEILALRESGREQIQTIVERAKAEYAAKDAAAKEDLTKIHMNFVNEVSRLEKTQAVEILSFVPAVGNTSSKDRDESRSNLGTTAPVAAATGIHDQNN